MFLKCWVFQIDPDQSNTIAAEVYTGRWHHGGGKAMTPTFFRSKNKKGKQRGKRKTFKAETVKRLSPKSKRHCFNHSRASRIQKIFLFRQQRWSTVFCGPSTWKSISSALISIKLSRGGEEEVGLYGGD